ncbi:MAG: hypothetical protein A2268_09190 [Candidatus Raymondbacteria bacterium RifOxyA12_full_50_37]|uniref:Glycosyltransferase 2-like domain-containing protein n=1 Tax=Candidatus Raymondbacteria bacterium RIFOXYD12_FULL_49_13 TaxID=1817890 RepID=A0A1F7F4Y0_UNCRA|nr:MAG: hypothetical protein A2268_09190 [Candidatus Raymondbacteria bacterium RifOxyA12_full_50_37]OGJ97715.1 MAG: hypothetical protein A2453_09740 [Candidatus Raymondbacteria bacterium RIFOXYC2_FULL_50_21]OGK01426.1 MAG: hypothetical protein A2487_15865 [Candidatus Raymondbacteria bacterium RifOxyC12_full_50_8]OGK01720.1 MAG: hypothetical protein A2519_22875 [Candidatus Raymondbacteria bacterium RIFOXYD12_FULL_49_13]OGP43624.1 MAG: hypothetical protein A2324_09385 [Candidatus Raymondbacteria 
MTLFFLYLIAAVCLCVLYACVILFLWRGLLRLKPGANTRNHSFSIVIAARNEEAILGACLDTVLDQDYPRDLFEVIVVDDRSTDATAAIVRQRAAVQTNITLVSITECPTGVSPKKNALTHGIAAAKGEIILFTDADCLVSNTWVSHINAHFSPTVGAVSGLTTYYSDPSLNRLFWGVQAADFFSHGVVSAAAMGAGVPLNTNANNFAVRKSVFDQIGGYGKVRHVVSGDDDLLLQAIARSGNWQVTYAPEQGAAVTTRPTQTLRGVWEQRKRWGSKTVFYNVAQRALLSGIFMFYCLIFAGFLALPFGTGPWVLLVACVFTVKTGLDLFLAKAGMRLFGNDALWSFFLVLAFIHVPLIVLAALFGIFGRFTWKDAQSRRVA